MTKGREAGIREALSELSADESAPVIASPGTRNTVLYHYDEGGASALPIGAEGSN